MSTPQDFTGYNPTWCPGCGNWGIGLGVKNALSQLGFTPSQVFIAFGIGCSGNANDFINAYAMHALHGRAIPCAIGMKLGNHTMPTMVMAGDGDCYGEGGNHFMHACRGNHDITVLTHDNRVYGLTTGQVAPTAHKGYKSKSTPSGIIEVPINSLALAITQGATFVAQAFAGDMPHMTQMIKAAISHKGFSLLNILQPCVTFNKIDTYQYYMKRIYKLDENYDASSMKNAILKAQEMREEKYPLGILYKEERPAFHEELPQLKHGALYQHKAFSSFHSILDEFI